MAQEGRRGRCARRPRAAGGPWARGVRAIGLIALAAATSHGAVAMAGESLSATREWDPTPHDWVFDLAVRGNELWAVGNRGVILRRGNDAWDVTPSPVDRGLFSIAFDDSGWGAIVGQLGTMLELQPGASDWQLVDLGSDKRLLWVEARPSGEAVAVGQYGTIYYRAPSEKRWALVANPWVEGSVDAKALEGLTAIQRIGRLRQQYGAPHLYAVAFPEVAGGEAIIVGERGLVVRLASGSAGEAPTVVEKAEHFGESLFTVIRCNGHLVAAGQEGRVAFSEDGGRTWVYGFIPAARGHIYDLGCGGDGKVVASSENALYGGHFSDGAWQWAEIQPSDVRLDWIAGIHLTPNGDAVVVGSNGVYRWAGALVTALAAAARGTRMEVTGRSTEAAPESAKAATVGSSIPRAAGGSSSMAAADRASAVGGTAVESDGVALATRSAPSESGQEDERIHAALTERLAGLLDGGERIAVRVENGVVGLSGTVTREADRQEAVKAARETRGVRDVNVNVLVGPASAANPPAPVTTAMIEAGPQRGPR